MSRLTELFKTKNKNVLNVYCTAGYPSLSSTMNILSALQDSGADMIEIGMPYSDPLADGPIIQESGSIALANGMSIAILLSQLKNLRDTIDVPVILMGYMNPVLQYGFEKFCAGAAACGIDGLILPDLPPYEFRREYGHVIGKYGLDFIFLVTPETPDQRVLELDALSRGFIYAVSSSSTTGSANKNEGLQDYLKRLENLPLKNPVLVGFGISDKASFDRVCQFAAGGIIGSAYIKALKNNEDVKAATKSFLSSILGA